MSGAGSPASQRIVGRGGSWWRGCLGFRFAIETPRGLLLKASLLPPPTPGSHSKSSRKFPPFQPGPSGRPPPWLMGGVAVCLRAVRNWAPLQSPQGLSLSCGQFLKSSWWRHRLQKGGYQRESREEGNEKGQVGQVYGVRGRLDFGVVSAQPTIQVM